MGQACSCDNPDTTEQAAPDTAGKPERKTKPPKIATTSSYDPDDVNSSSSDSEPPTAADIKNTDSIRLGQDSPTTKAAREGALTGYKDAILKGNDSLAMYFVAEWPDLNLLDMKFGGDTCLHVAPNDINPETGDTSLHEAVRTRDVNLVALLCKYAADANIENNARESPLSIASGNNDDDIVELLSPETQQMIRARIGTVYAPNSHQHHQLDSPVDDDGGMTPQGKELTDMLDGILDDANTPPSPELTPNHFPEVLPTTHIAATESSDMAPLQKALSAEEKRKLDVMKIQRTNPFTQLKRSNTKQALLEIEKMADAKTKLPPLAAWLEKKSHSPPYSWQKRWVLVKGSHFLWSDIQRDIKDPKSLAERKKWNNSVSLLSVIEVKAVVKGKTQRKFIVVAGTSGTKNKRKEYLWKCATKADRDYWVKGLKKHINHFKSVVSYLGTKHGDMAM